MIDYPSCGTYQRLARWRPSDVPQLTVLFRDNLDAADRPQRRGHLLPKLALQRLLPQELSNSNADAPVRLLAESDPVRADAAYVRVVYRALPALFAVFIQFVGGEPPDFVRHPGIVATRTDVEPR